MQITLDDVQVEGRRSPMLEATTLSVSSGECVLLAGEPGHGHTALALVATGRLAPYTGTVTLVEDDGSTTTSTAELRRVTAVVDVPGISEPDEALTVGDVVAEELSLAGRRSLPGDAKRWLADHDLLDRRGERIDALHGAVRTALLSSLASERKDVRFVVLTLPDRHSGEPSGWWSVAESLASLGYGVMVECTRSSARDLGAELAPARGADALRAAPVEALRTRPEPAVLAPVGGGPEEEGVEETDPTRLFDREAPGRHQATGEAPGDAEPPGPAGAADPAGPVEPAGPAPAGHADLDAPAPGKETDR
ncbi:hypothetical protein ASE27_01980 [Oerskovia sp. Root918]|uniref:hypothetical protein n=1 Tax=unclassified Oerskovia TaxID=2619021 RepID=UPI0007009539|nr:MULTISPECIES: hypothetical protein [unclassified Oerskovia]KRC42674.1 hypothetical protein ASE15_01170 [Oerskovia sp. Root22]KRD47189.1 hypothetical protein ASE27_01980 [Oerskovia sp. Root918]